MNAINGISELVRCLGDMADALDVGPLTRSVRRMARKALEAHLSDEEREAVQAELLNALHERLFEAGYAAVRDRGPMHNAARSLRALAAQLSPRTDGWPEVLTESEAVRFLRLDTENGPGDPYQVLYRYRKRCLLKAVQIGRQVFYPRKELMLFLQRKTEGNF